MAIGWHLRYPALATAIEFTFFIPILCISLLYSWMAVFWDLTMPFGRRFSSHLQSKDARPKHVVITGASSGIGESLAYLYAQDLGVKQVSLLGRRMDRLESVAQECRRLNADLEKAMPVQVDVTDTEALDEALMHLDDSCPIDLLIVNAGATASILLTKNSAEQFRAQDFLDVLKPVAQVNLVGAISTFEPMLRRFMQRRSGQVALMSSIAGLVDVPSAPSYSMTKRALVSLGTTLRPVLARYNVRMNVICPGLVNSEITQSMQAQVTYMKKGAPHMTASDAAASIQYGLQRDIPLISFPYSSYLLFRMLDRLAPQLREKLFNLQWRFSILISPADEVGLWGVHGRGIVDSAVKGR